MDNPIKNILRNKKSIYSVCSANKYVLIAAMRHAKKNGRVLLIESTSNQVNQYGGYSGLIPRTFVQEMHHLAEREGFPAEDLVLGGDHLGPFPWKSLDKSIAMKKAEELVRAYVEAGFTKIHIDTSMRLGGDDLLGALDLGIIAARAAQLALVVEEAYNEVLLNNPQAVRPVMVVGSEVPIPGGSLTSEEEILPTKVKDFVRAMDVFQYAFESKRIAWENVVAFVVQPGIEFGDDFVIPYSREKARKLCSALEDYRGLIFEGHSTDYQNMKCLRNMVEDGIKILKVGPELTFALREVIMQMSHIEQIVCKMHNELCETGFSHELLASMDKDPSNWKKYYTGKPQEIEFKKLYSFSDRCRYYLNNTNVDNTILKMVINLKTSGIPLALLSQYMPKQYEKIINGQLDMDVWSIVYDRIMDVLDRYLYACTLGDGRESY